MKRVSTKWIQLGASVLLGLTMATAQAQTWWKPGVNTTWQWQLTGTVNTSYNVDVYDVDLFDTPTQTIAQLKAAGRKVVCYFSAGSSENWRSDFNRFQAADMGNALDGWDGERWLDTRSVNVRSIMLSRLDLAVSKGCDGVEPDNVDGYSNSTGFSLTSATQLDYNKYLANAAHGRGLAIALKNDVDQLSALEPYFDMAVNEQCNQYAECGGYSVFTSKGKPVFNAEYASKYRKNTSGARDKLCAAMATAKIRTLVLALDLDDSYRFSCF
ncbi:endo alpha-1,4 polygalactosaminidase [Roseateles amylovorans]|uniref:endo alpha-1,4 polygalactosaminidase n=1 Tax=Roseateles amylovorans TaxID=2978473 RepID=UPI003F4974BE